MHVKVGQPGVSLKGVRIGCERGKSHRRLGELEQLEAVPSAVLQQIQA